MIRQSLAFDDILEKKFKILRTSIMLGNLKNREDTMREYESTAREIDKIRSSVYEELLASKMYTTITLEEELDRLKELISFIETRVKERNEFVDDYIKITSNLIDGLERISLEDELLVYRNRYDNIDDYLKNCRVINEIQDKLKKLRDELEEKYENKANNEIINLKLEDELIDEFNKFISRNEYYSELNYTDIDLELTKLDESILDKKSVLDTFTSSYQALINAGISGAEREEYSSYVQDARVSYYEDIEKKCILNIYKLVLDKQVDYEKLYNKREKLDEVINDRNRIRASLEINNRDQLEYFINLCNEQFSIIKSQKYNIENIDKLILEISDLESKLEKLYKDNSRSEIVEILDEYSVVNNEIEKIELPDEEKIINETYKMIEKKPANLVVRVKEPIKINVKNVSDTAKLVMKKVVIVLEPKKFGNQRDKIKEAELELEREKRELEIKKLEEEKTNFEIENNTLEESNNLINVDEDDSVNNTSYENKDIFLDDDEFENDEIDNTSYESKDIFLDDDEFENEDTINIENNAIIELDTQDVFDDKSITNREELTDVKLNISSNSIPTEIIIEEPKREEVNLFKETDPFLDDNEFELDKSSILGDSDEVMPMIGSIGTVKPNNVLSQINNVVNENKDVILPNLGLVDNVNEDIPIVSENYIN